MPTRREARSSRRLGRGIEGRVELRVGAVGQGQGVGDLDVGGDADAFEPLAVDEDVGHGQQEERAVGQQERAGRRRRRRRSARRPACRACCRWIAWATTSLPLRVPPLMRTTRGLRQLGVVRPAGAVALDEGEDRRAGVEEADEVGVAAAPAVAEVEDQGVGARGAGRRAAPRRASLGPSPAALNIGT